MNFSMFCILTVTVIKKLLRRHSNIAMSQMRKLIGRAKCPTQDHRVNGTASNLVPETMT